MIHVATLRNFRALPGHSSETRRAAKSRRWLGPEDRFSGLRRLFLCLHLLLFTVYSSYAPGFMPGLQADGFTVILCTDDGPAAIQVDSNGQPVEQQPERCMWSVHVNQASLTDIPRIAAALEPHGLTLAAPRSLLAEAHYHTAQNRPRAPPFIL